MQNIIKIFWAIAIVFIFFNSIYYSIKLGFPQFRVKKILTSIKSKKEKNKISIKDTFLMSLASKIGAGSIAGISFAIFYGGVGTIFWIWISSFIVSINCFLENVLSTIFKEKDGDNYKGGPAFYIKKGLNNKKLAITYSVIAILAYIFGFLTIQNNTITTLINNIYNIDKYIIALIITILASIVIIKGLKTISNICNKIVPIMTFIYMTLGIIVIITNIDKIPTLLTSIITNAFNNKSITGGFIYIFLTGMQKGIFSTEAGLGTNALVSGATNNLDYKKQGYIGILETYFITLFIITVTGFIIMLSNYEILNISNINGIEITRFAFDYHFGSFGEIVLLIILLLFSFSTIITVYYYGESNLKFLTNNRKLIMILKLITIICLFLGGISSSVFIWNIVDLFLALLAIINMYSIFKLRHLVLKKLR